MHIKGFPVTEAMRLRFLSKVEKGEGCWLWLGALYRNGYGVFYVAKVGERQVYALAHRASLTLAGVDLADDAVVCHRCDTPRCVRPDHMFVGTHADNVADMIAKGRGYQPPRRTHCPKGHALDAVNLYVNPSSGQLVCRTCRAAHLRAWRARRRTGGA